MVHDDDETMTSMADLDEPSQESSSYWHLSEGSSASKSALRQGVLTRICDALLVPGKLCEPVLGQNTQVIVNISGQHPVNRRSFENEQTICRQSGVMIIQCCWRLLVLARLPYTTHC
ncbi:hypothetical protein BsWGS_11232 [Bradybaena similaris]